MKRYNALTILSLTSLAFSIFLSGCDRYTAAVNPTPVSVSDESTISENDQKEIVTDAPETDIVKSDEISNEDRIAVTGPYGEISLNLPNGWTYQICPPGDEALPIGLYGMRLRPDTQESGWLDLVYTDSFGVCGTGLSTEHRTIAGDDAEIGTYDEHDHWDYVAFEGRNDGIIAQTGAEWISDVKEESLEILDTMCFDPNKTSGAAYIYSSEAESDEIAVIMDLSNISGTGATIRFRQYEERKTGELIYGEGYAISRLENDEWAPVPQIIDNGAFPDIGYTIPVGGEAKIETNWEWLYGRLPKGTYRISKTILDSYDNGYDEYVLYGKFLIGE
ncbi:MAG: hypothetical protein IJT16_08570 [Lachnospiraceae bacterium]|nr:hypothetical protein [Lachnospiraceae bacterium]